MRPNQLFRILLVTLVAIPSLPQGAVAEEGWSLRGLVQSLFGEGDDPATGEGPYPDPTVPRQPDAASPVPAVPVPGDAVGADRRVPGGNAEIQLSFAPLVKETAPAVVNVYAARAVPARQSPFANDPFFGQFFGQRFDSRPRMESSLGSGVIVDATGLVVTNNHVVADADEVRIAFADGREFQTTVLLKDDKVDLAVLKIDGEGPFPMLAMANSDGLEIGDLVLAIGNPFGIGQTVTNGIVSALARTHIGVNDFGFFIQTDAAINPGNSGGALIDMQGQLVGVNTAIFSRSGGSNGIGFAILSNMVASFVRAAREGDRFEQPFLGAGFAPVTPDIAEALGLDRPTGALVHEVGGGTPAAEAGLEVGDVILTVGDVAIDSPDALGYRLATTGIGGVAKLQILRGDERLALDLPLQPAPETPPRDERVLGGDTPFAGTTVLNLSPRVASELDLPMNKTGVVVTAVARGSYAARFGLRPRDILLTLNGETIESTEALETMLGGRFLGWRFELERDGRRMAQMVR
ncbi:Do family serine endopeptidase [Aurantimonas aggregata]|uniref:Do family serine endopeptidase n=1 Tax=Aurantimonas aggregata TaxID=2047720 RepID=A0A6L9MJE9_9HYPH|nr:Do family serine endopeptidase [Aurantimonas aggregata]NDV88014.1 Do family serine endopeptidase [Aurantimonas aggregata]